MAETGQSESGADPAVDGGESWIEERLALSSLDYTIPKAANHWTYMLGGLTAFFIVVLLITGVYLGQFYNPTPVGAHDSVMYLIARAPLGDWIRSLHFWSTGAVVITITAHLIYVFMRRSYRKPREMTWWAGVAMAALVFLLLVTGTALRYDQEGFEALAHFVAGGNLTGALGAFFTEGFTLSTTLLSRIFALHTSLLPLILLALLALHFFLIRQLGIHADRTETSVFRVHAMRLGSISLLAFVVVGLLAAFAPEGLGYPAVAGVEMTKPMWPVLWVYGLENLLGAWGMVIGPALIFGFLAIVPIMDRGEGGRRAVQWIGIALAVVVVGLALFAAFGPTQQHMGM
ncbi:MAG: cytochrome b N-terminal domain-containing protein [Gemmatimonadota bacterium]